MEFFEECGKDSISSGARMHAFRIQEVNDADYRSWRKKVLKRYDPGHFDGLSAKQLLLLAYRKLRCCLLAVKSEYRLLSSPSHSFGSLAQFHLPACAVLRVKRMYPDEYSNLFVHTLV